MIKFNLFIFLLCDFNEKPQKLDRYRICGIIIVYSIKRGRKMQNLQAEMRVRNHKIVNVSEHAKHRFISRLQKNINTIEKIDISNLPAVPVSTRRHNTRPKNVVTYYLVRIFKQDIVMLVEDSKLKDGSVIPKLSTVMNNGPVVEAVWEAGIVSLEEKLAA